MKKDLFAERIERFEAELSSLYNGIYHNEEEFSAFKTMLKEMYKARPIELKKLDDRRLSDESFQSCRDILGMQVYADAFADTLRGVKEKLPFISECGVNYLHLMPLLKSPEGKSDGGYAVSDFREVEPKIGNMDDLSSLAAECRKKGIYLCLDLVLNHTSDEHIWAKKAKAGDPEYMSRYFFFDNWDEPREYDKTAPFVFPTTAPGNFSWCPEAGKVVMTTFHPYQWDLNYKNPAVLRDMTENMLYLCNRGVDVVRLDAVPYIWKEKGTSCRNLPQAHALLRILRIACETVCPGVRLLGEVVMEPRLVAPYFGTPERPECHMLYNVTTMATLWHTVATRDTRLLRDQLSKVFSLPKEYTFLNYLRCHDDIGWGLDYGFLSGFGVSEWAHKRFLNDYLSGRWQGSPARGELFNDDPASGDARLCGTCASLCGIEAALYEGDGEKLLWAVRLDIMLHAFIFSLSGVPVLYGGDEQAALNDYGYRNDEKKRGDARWLHRGKTDWEKAKLRHDESTPQGMVFSGIKKLSEARGKHRVFSKDADVWITDSHDNGVLALGRYHSGEKFLGVFNFSDSEKRVSLNEYGDFYDMATGEKADLSALNIPSGGFMWLFAEL